MQNKFAKLFDYEGVLPEGQILVTIAHNDESSLITLTSSVGQEDEPMVHHVKFDCDESAYEDNPYHEAIEYFENLTADQALEIFGLSA